ncbi:MAG TPA: STAS domain-containing protein [Candidatus Aminicenantes bacterium]|nr:STAS domain-containing protein [Candidatus Aminicenantes bacterium]
MRGKTLTLCQTRHGNVIVVSLQGSLDHNGAAIMERACLQLISAGDSRLLLDLADVDYISSSGLRSLLVVAKTVKTVQGRIALCRLSPTSKEVMALSGFNTIVSCWEDPAAAREDLAR